MAGGRQLGTNLQLNPACLAIHMQQMVRNVDAIIQVCQQDGARAAMQAHAMNEGIQELSGG